MIRAKCVMKNSLKCVLVNIWATSGMLLSQFLGEQKVLHQILYGSNGSSYAISYGVESELLRSLALNYRTLNYWKQSCIDLLLDTELQDSELMVN